MIVIIKRAGKKIKHVVENFSDNGNSVSLIVKAANPRIVIVYLYSVIDWMSITV